MTKNDLPYQFSQACPYWLKQLLKPAICSLLEKKENKDLEKRALPIFRKFIKKGDLVFDIGAYHGVLTDIFLNLEAKVVCVEPQPSCIKILKSKYFSNKKVVIVEKGISCRKQKLTLLINELSPSISSFSKKWIKQNTYSGQRWDKKTAVKMTTLDSLIQEYGIPDFCKIDVEGLEKDVLQGLSYKLPVVLFEFCNIFSQDTLSCLNRLSSLGQYRYNYSLFGNYKFELPYWVVSDKINNKLARIRKSVWGDIYAKTVT